MKHRGGCATLESLRDFHPSLGPRRPGAGELIMSPYTVVLSKTHQKGIEEIRGGASAGRVARGKSRIFASSRPKAVADRAPETRVVVFPR